MNQDNLLRVGQALVLYNPGNCRGVFISPNIIATAAHCLRDRHPTDIPIHLRNGKVIHGSIAHADYERDIGLIRTETYHHQEPLELHTTYPSEGSKIARAGLLNQKSKNGLAFDWDDGILERVLLTRPSHASPWRSEMLCLRLESEQQGYSGSPILYDGKVLGILVAGNSLGQTFAVPSHYIHELL